MILSTPRLSLTPLAASDLDDLTALYADPRAMQYFGPGGPLDRAEASRRLDRFLTVWAQRPFGIWGLRRDGMFIGHWGLDVFHEFPDEVFLRGVLTPPFWRMGYSREAISRILSYAFDEVRMRMIIATAFEGNTSSQKLLTGLGFQNCGLVSRWDRQLVEFRLTPADLKFAG